MNNPYCDVTNELKATPQVYSILRLIAMLNDKKLAVFIRRLEQEGILLPGGEDSDV